MKHNIFPVFGSRRLYQVILMLGLMATAALAISLSIDRAQALSTTPTTMNFQGRLTSSSGSIMSDGLYNMTFRIYDASTAGTLKWSEVRETTNRVQLTNGLFSVQLGQVTPLDPSIFASGSLYFEIELPTPATATCSTAGCGSYTEGPMSPRSKLSTSAYAYNAETLDGIDSSGFIQNTTATQQGNITVQSPNSSNVVATFQGAAGQTADLQQWRSSTALMARMVSNGRLLFDGLDSAVTAVDVTSGGVGTGSVRIGGAGGYFQKIMATSGDVALVVTPPAATSTTTLQHGGKMRFGTSYWNGTASVTEYSAQQLVRNSANPGDYRYDMYSSARLYSQYAGAVGLTVQGASGQTANLFQAQDSTGAALASISASGGLSVKSAQVVASSAPTSDLAVIDNIANPTITNNANGLKVAYAGGAAAVEGAGIRVDYTPGSTSGGTWSGMRIVANPTGPAVGVTSYGLKLEGPTTPGAGSEVGLRVASGFDIGIDVASGGLQLSSMNDPSSAAAGSLKVYAQTNAGRTMLKTRDQYGLTTTVQPFLGTNRVTVAQPFNNATGFGMGSFYGSAAPVIASYNSGTTTASTAFTAVQIETTSFYSGFRRGAVLTSTAAGTVGGVRGPNSAPLLRGNGSSVGGFYYVARFGIGTYQTGLRSFAGLYNSTATAPNAEPSSLTNIAGVACDAADTSFSFISNDGTGSATKIPLGANFPCNTSGIDMYEVRLFAPPSASTIYYSLARLNTTDYIEGSTSVAADLPNNVSWLMPFVYINNTTAAQAQLDFASYYAETDN